MKMKQVLSSTSIYGKSLRALVIVAALAQLSFSSAFSISISPSEVVIPPGGTANYTITVTGPSAATGVDFSITGLPPDSTATITRESGTVFALAITTSRLTRQGEYVFTVTATSGDMSASASAKVIVLI